MKIAVLSRVTPDLVEELEIDEAGKLRKDYLRFIPNELDEYALEEALLLKERHNADVTAFSFATPLTQEAAEDMLYTFSARGADKIFLVEGEFEYRTDLYAQISTEVLKNFQWDVLLLGVQTTEDIDGALGGRIASLLKIPYVGGVAKATYEASFMKVQKEFPGGLLEELEVDLPCVIGMQSAERPPRYVLVSAVRAAKKRAKIERISIGERKTLGPEFLKMFKPTPREGATILEGTPEEVVDDVMKILEERGLLKI